MSTDTGADELWPALRGLTTRMDPVPPLVIAAARQSLAWRDPDAALAELLADHADEQAMAGVRSGEGAHLFTFGVDDLTIELEADVDARDIRLTGQLVPPQPADITVHHAGGELTTVADELGRFQAATIARGPVRLTCQLVRGDGHRTIHTAWTLI
jgi:hypothetical protein